MRRLRNFVITLIATFGMSIFTAAPAHAGIPVLDIGNLIQSILSVLNEVTSIANEIEGLTNQVQQIGQLGDQLNAVTGVRNFGDVLNNPLLQNYIPANVIQDYNSLSGGYQKLSGLTKQLRDSSMIYNCLDQPQAKVASCQARFAKPYSEISTIQTALETTTKRLDQINQLMQKINTTQDPKAIAELQGRIQGENASLTNELTRSQLTIAMYQAEDKAERSRQEEARIQGLHRTGTIIPANF